MKAAEKQAAAEKAAADARRSRRALTRAINTLLRLGLDELEAGHARRVDGAGWSASRYPSQGKDRPDTDVIRIEIRVGEAWPDRFGAV